MFVGGLSSKIAFIDRLKEETKIRNINSKIHQSKKVYLQYNQLFYFLFFLYLNL